MIEIEKGVPIPKADVGRDAKYPFAQMEVGDSFVLKKDATTADRLNSSTKFRKKRYGEKYIQRSIGDEIRVWRVE